MFPTNKPLPKTGGQEIEIEIEVSADRWTIHEQFEGSEIQSLHARNEIRHGITFYCVCSTGKRRESCYD